MWHRYLLYFWNTTGPVIVKVFERQFSSNCTFDCNAVLAYDISTLLHYSYQQKCWVHPCLCCPTACRTTSTRTSTTWGSLTSPTLHCCQVRPGSFPWCPTRFTTRFNSITRPETIIIHPVFVTFYPKMATVTTNLPPPPTDPITNTSTSISQQGPRTLTNTWLSYLIRTFTTCSTRWTGTRSQRRWRQKSPRRKLRPPSHHPKRRPQKHPRKKPPKRKWRRKRRKLSNTGPKLRWAKWVTIKSN